MGLTVWLECGECESQLWGGNITHNLGTMARKAGIYKHLWHPEELGISKAGELIEPLREGLEKLRAEPFYFYQFEPENGWGTYDALVQFVNEYLNACQAHPDAKVIAST